MASSRWLRLARAVARNVLILGSCFVLLEIGTRLAVPHRADPARVVRDIDQERRIAFLPHVETVYETDEFRFTVRTNRFGRRDVDWPPEVMADPRSIVFIGDSMVFGYGVEREDAVPALLEERLAAGGDPREVLDFSLVACSLPTYTALLDEALRLGVAAETVLVGITVGNDFSDDVLEVDPLRPRPARNPGAQPARSPWRSDFLAYLRRRASGSPVVVGSLLTLGRWLGIDFYDTSGSYIFLRQQTPAQESVFRSVLDMADGIAATARENGRKLSFVIFPNKIQVENADELTGAIYDARKPNRLVLEKCQALGVPCLDLLPVLAAAYEGGSGPLFFPVDRHANPTGNRIIADGIFRFLSGGAGSSGGDS